MPNIADTGNDLDYFESQTLIEPQKSRTERGKDIEQGVREWFSLSNSACNNVYDIFDNTSVTPVDRSGETIGEGASGHNIVHTIHTSLDRISLPKKLKVWIVSSGRRELSYADFRVIAADPSRDPEVSRGGWLDWNGAKLVDIRESEFSWNANQALTPSDQELLDAVVLASTADYGSSIRTSSAAWLVELLDRLSAMRHLEPGWDSYRALPPNDWALKKAKEALWAFASLRVQPDKVLPSVENGVGISVTRGERYGFLEVFNSQEVVGVTACGDNPYSVLEFDPANIAEGVEWICAFATG